MYVKRQLIALKSFFISNTVAFDRLLLDQRRCPIRFNLILMRRGAGKHDHGTRTGKYCDAQCGYELPRYLSEND
jgi:hypothetical protein